MLSPIPTINLEYIAMSLNTNMGDHPPVAPRVEPLSNEGVVQGSSPWQVVHLRGDEMPKNLSLQQVFPGGSVPFSRREAVRRYVEGFKRLMIEIMGTSYPSSLSLGVDTYVPLRIEGQRKHCVLKGASKDETEGAGTYHVYKIRITPKLLEWAFN